MEHGAAAGRDAGWSYFPSRCQFSAHSVAIKQRLTLVSSVVGAEKMLNQVNILTPFTLLGRSFLLARRKSKNSTSKHDKETGKFADAGLCPSAKKKQATVDQHRPHNVLSAIVLLRMPLVWETSSIKFTLSY